jgi:type II secretory pathway component GspD/PulD (secretin)
MKLFSFRSACSALAVASLMLLASNRSLAQGAGGGGAGRGGGGGGGIGGGGGAVGGGGGGAGGGTASATRTYINSTMVGDAMITSDMDTRRLIVVTDEDTNLNIKTIIAGLDKPKPQVLINVVFLQVEHDNDLDLGTQATYTGKVAIKTDPTGTATTNFGIPTPNVLDPGTYGGFYSLIGRDVSATIRALASTNKTEVLSRPSILTRSNQQATIIVGQSIPIVNNSQVSAETGAITNTFTYQDVGIILKVTPFITDNGYVEMIVSPQISSLSATTIPIAAGVSEPVIDKRSADTVVVTPSDKTVIIGGLISNEKDDNDTKVPILGDIPLIGFAFKHKVTSKKKTELLIFLTPHIVESPDDLAHLADEERGKLELTPKTFEKDDMSRYINGK